MKNNRDNQALSPICLTVTGSFFYSQGKKIKEDYIPLTAHSIPLKREDYDRRRINGYVPLTNHYLPKEKD